MLCYNQTVPGDNGGLDLQLQSLGHPASSTPGVTVPVQDTPPLSTQSGHFLPPGHGDHSLAHLPRLPHYQGSHGIGATDGGGARNCVVQSYEGVMNMMSAPDVFSSNNNNRVSKGKLIC